MEEQEVSQDEELHYQIKGYSDDHQKYAQVSYRDGYVSEYSSGFTDDTNEWRILEHAKDLVERNDEGDQEAAITLFQEIFGERNVFLKKEDF